MAQDVTIAGAQFSAVPSIIVPKTGGGSAKFVDTSGDTVKADGMLSDMTAHGADGNLIMGSLIDGIATYVSDTITFKTATILNDYVIDIGFVPNLFFFYYAGSGVTIPSDYRLVTSTFYSKQVNVGAYYSEIYRGLHAYRGSSTATLVSYSDYNFRPYDNGSVKGVIGVSGSNYKMNGTYRWFGIKTTEIAITATKGGSRGGSEQLTKEEDIRGTDDEPKEYR